MTDEVLVTRETELLLHDGSETFVEQVTHAEILEVAVQGPPGPRGLQGERGPIGDVNGALMVTARLAEFDTDEAKAAARENLGLAVIDGGTFF